METEVYHKECCCLHGDSDIKSSLCNKRYYNIYSIEDNEHKTIIVCNEYIRLKLNERNHLKCRISYIDFMKDIISNYAKIGFKIERDLNNNDILNHKVFIDVCERPRLWSYITIKECLTSIEDMSETSQREWIIRDKLYYAIDSYLSSNSLYKKYKTKYAEAIRINKRLKNSYGTKREIELINLFNCIFKIKIKTEYN